MGWPPEIMSSACATDTSLGSRWVPSEPGSTPISTSGKPSRVPCWEIRQWHAIASSSPPPSTVPCKVAMIGRSAASRRASVPLYGEASKAGSSKLRMSPPATNVRPRQAMTKAFSEASASNCETACTRPAMTSADSALTGGLSISRRPMPPSLVRQTQEFMYECLLQRYLESSSLPIWLRCTSSGPSASRSRRAVA